MSAVLLSAVLSLSSAISSPPSSVPIVEPIVAPIVESKVGAMTIIVKRVPNAELVATQLWIRGGARNWSKDDAGVEDLALRVATQGGTQSLDKIAFGRKLASIGANITSNTDLDESTIYGKGPLSSFDDVLGLITDTFLRPAMPAAEVELQRQDLLATIKHVDEDADAHLHEMVEDALFKGMPYENHSTGTLDTVGKLTLAQLNAQMQKLREQSRLVLVVVGDVDPKVVIKKARAAYGKVPAGAFVEKPMAKPSYSAAASVGEDRKLPTNYIQGMYLGPQYGTADFAVGVATRELLNTRLFEEVRTKRNLSYAPGVRSVSTDIASWGGIYVTAVDPNATIPVMIGELKRLQSEPINDNDLASTRAMTRTTLLMGDQATDAQAHDLARGFIHAGDVYADQELEQRIANVTAAEIQAFAKKYFSKLQFVVLGDPKKLDDAIAKSF
ncbi:MAG TPA: insulinase family protein [Myxococcota bacterium]